MIERLAVTADDYRTAARKRLPRFLFDYVDGAAGAEQTLAANRNAWAHWQVRQRVLVDVSQVSTTATIAGQSWHMPLVLAPIGLAGMMARRGEAQAARAATAVGVPFTLSTVGICGFAEITAATPWFQLYMLRDRGVVGALLERAWAAGVRTLLFTVDLPLAGPRHRDPRNGLGVHGLRPTLLRLAQLAARPAWIADVGLRGKPHGFGCLAELVPAARSLADFKAWVDTQFDPTVTLADIDWLRAQWRGRLLIKGVLDVSDAVAVIGAGVDGVVVSNHGGRQLDGAPATALQLPAISEAIAGRGEVLVDGGLRSGIDVFRAIALGATGVLIGRPWVYGLAAAGERGVASLLRCWQHELACTMAFAGVTTVAAIGRRHLLGLV